MDYDNSKTFKSKTVELGGNKFRITHKSSNVLSNKLWITLGMTYYFVKEVYKICLGPIIQKINEWSDLFVMLSLIFGFITVVIGILALPITTMLLDQEIHSCISEGYECENLINYCENEYKNSQYNKNISNDLWNCMHNINYYNYWIEYKKNLFHYLSLVTYYFILAIVIIFLIAYVIYFLNKIIKYVIDKITILKNNISEQIPEIEMV